MSEEIFGHSWQDIQNAQQGGSLSKPVDTRKSCQDYGTDPVGNGMVRMVPSGDVVSVEEAHKRLGKKPQSNFKI